MGIVFKNNAKTTLASNLSNSATSATVTDGSVFPTLGAGEFFLITFDDGTNNEICKCTARSSNTLTIVRAQDNTSARAFSSGDAAEGRVTAGVLETIQENIAAKSANQTVYNATTASSATAYNIGIDPGVEANAMVFLDGVMQHHDTFSFSGSTLTFDAAPVDGTKLEVIVDNLINLQSSNLTVDTFTAADVGGSAQTDFTLSDTPAAETNLIVFVEGVFQDQDAYTISSNTLSITTGVIAGRGVTVYVINPVNIGTPSDGTITSAKLSGNLTLPGTLTVGANDVAFDSPTFVVDNSNSRVGLGTASPTVPVDIVGETKMSSHLTLGTDSKVQFRDTAIYINSSADGQLDLVADTEIQIAATTIDMNGNLDLSGDLTVQGGQINTGNTSGDHSEFGTDGSGHTFIDASTSGGSIFLQAAGSTKVTMNSTGFVGIGDTNPSQAGLQIKISTASAAGGSSDYSSGTNMALLVENSASGGYPRIFHKAASTSVASVTNAETGKSMYWGETTDTGNYYFRGRDLLVTEGDVGIGTSNPTLGKVQIDGGSTGGRFDALTVKHGETNTTGDGPAIRFEGYYSSNAWALAEMSATNGGAGYGANFSIDTHPGGGTQSSATVPTFSLVKTHEGIVRQKLNAQTFTLAANAQETFTDYCNTTALVNIASQRNGSNSIIYTGGLFYVVYSSSVITEIADVNDLFLTADTSAGAGKICIYKGNASATFYIVNRTSHTMTLSVHVVEMQGN